MSDSSMKVPEPKVWRGDEQVERKVLSEWTTTVILNEAEAGALACPQSPIYAYRGLVNYPTRETHSQNYWLSIW
jgi:hypothetical protein